MKRQAHVATPSGYLEPGDRKIYIIKRAFTTSIFYFCTDTFIQYIITLWFGQLHLNIPSLSGFVVKEFPAFLADKALRMESITGFMVCLTECFRDPYV